jgi:2-C-methyl-D-erythritol 4-phosphate cytidylyltransferase/2-C-methyl-D-erythritol 2,4-cyclodiphosphate synthase
VASARVWAIVPAAGRGERFAAATPGSPPKQYSSLLGRSLLEWSLTALLADTRIHAVVAVLSEGDAHWPAVSEKFDPARLLTALGGAQRQDTVLNGLQFLESRAQEQDWVLVHDAARPCLNSADLTVLIDTLDSGVDGVVLAAPVFDTVRRELAGQIETVDRNGLWRALTPQIFRFGQLRRALLEAARDHVTVTDEAQALERLGVRAKLVAGSPFNIKVTRPEDLGIAAGILTMQNGFDMRVGQGMDVHAYGAGDHVILGGVRIAHSQGVVAHSDGDVVIHALCDALLGALGDGDIGIHFPDSDPRYRGADSRVFLRVVAERMKAAGMRLVNADVTVLAEAPRVAAHRGAMADNLAADLNVPATAINIKATTTERLGFIGRKEGLAAMASVLLSRQ